ncbi:hypothetical protein L208DRAFT_279869 [Tricholoma matsutake]|nr:hypothetical protein L208DRAFT_279869 [Tricholoma matsutake 945]
MTTKATTPALDTQRRLQRANRVDTTRQRNGAARMTATGGMGATASGDTRTTGSNAREGWSMPSSSCMLSSFFFLLILLCFYINERGKRWHQTKRGERQPRKGRTRPKAGSPQ